MALSFSANTDKVSLPTTPASLDDLTVATIAAWVYWDNNSANEEIIFNKGAGFAQHQLVITTGNAIDMIYARNPTSTRATASNANFAAMGEDKWVFIVGQNDTGTAGNNKIWVGDLTTLAAEPSAYSTQTAGSGSHTSNAAATPCVGNRTGDNRPWVGRIACVYIFNSLLTQTEIWRLQRDSFAKAALLNLHLLSTTKMIDYSGNAFHGTLTGSALADHVPLADIFGAKKGFSYVVSGGGTGYTKDVSGALTPSAIIVKLTGRALAGSITPAGALVKETRRALAGAITPAATLTAIKTALKSLDGSITPAATIVKQTVRSLAGNITPSAVENALTSRRLTGSITPTSTLTASSVFLKALAGAITPAATLVRSTLKVLAGAIAPAGAAVRAIATARTSGSLTPNGVVVKHVVLRALTGAIALAGAVAGVPVSSLGSLLGITDTSTLARYLPFSTEPRALPHTTKLKR